MTERLKMYIRVFFIQSLWNFERMQNIGFLFLIAPFLDKFYIDKEKRKDAYLRHLEFFNTHPYMASLIASLTVKMEKEISDGHYEFIPAVINLKQSTASPLAAIGDSFFWGILRNTAALIAIFFIILAEGISNRETVVLGLSIPIGFFILYNFFHLFLRYFLTMKAFVFGKDVLGFIAKPQMKSYMSAIKKIGIVFFTASLILYLYFFSSAEGGSFFQISITDLLVFSAGFVLSLFLGKFASIVKLYLIILLCVLWAYIGK
ncbi:MAG: PTS system mannose/fructose/sorbose family transporter subunit IID [Elusimicrobiota bacterium]|jgi:mannose/fructose/N-acetylgalactosamine-specific phosphotransferase system component IID|nr:PTS system mannose/fructose/sorbose family transporter subunit IID [Elusimicrobiota bacterium]